MGLTLLFYNVSAYIGTASAFQWSEFLAADPEVSGSISGSAGSSE
jgi:hypothetical protein